MSYKTLIEWTELRLNPIKARNRETGKLGWFCIHASDGCAICHSETKNRWIGTQIGYSAASRDKVEIFLDERALKAKLPSTHPLALVFLCDMTDLFGPFVSDAWLERIFAFVRANPSHTFQILTKRAGRQRHYFQRHPPPDNLWVGGVSVEQRRWLVRLDRLRITPAALRFVSFEPLLGDLGEFDLAGVDWVITGAESDPWNRARPMQLDWVRNIRDHCIAAGVPFFLKQTAVRGRKVSLPELDGRQWRQFPNRGQSQ
jgi:protein gp37